MIMIEPPIRWQSEQNVAVAQLLLGAGAAAHAEASHGGRTLSSLWRRPSNLCPLADAGQWSVLGLCAHHGHLEMLSVLVAALPVQESMSSM
jgi:hypothetical protein